MGTNSFHERQTYGLFGKIPAQSLLKNDSNQMKCNNNEQFRIVEPKNKSTLQTANANG